MGNGNDLAGSEQMKRTSVRMHASLIDEIDNIVEESEQFGSRNEVFATLAEQFANRHNGDAPTVDREPPAEEDLRTGYKALRRLSRGRDSWLPEDVALSELAQQTSRSTESARRTILLPLCRRGYVQRRSDLTGYTAVRVFE
jgi:Arc/MetJ-type ribon-helix-helix transcriptional regulator